MEIQLIDNLIYLPILGIVVLLWLLGSKLFDDLLPGELSFKVSKPIDFKVLDSIKLNIEIEDGQIEKVLDSKIRRTLKKVYYINLSGRKYEFDRIDAIDYGLILQFDNDEYINWIWKEGENDFEKGRIIPTGFYIDFSNILKLLKGHELLFEVSKSKNWISFIGREIKDIELIRKGSGSNKICENLNITTYQNNKVFILSTGEPTVLNKSEIEVNLEFGVDYITIVFDETLIKEY